MRKSNTQKLSDIVKEYIDHMMIGKKLKEVSVINAWEELLGKTVSSRTTSIYIKNKVLFVQLSSSVVRNELMMMRQEIINRLNEKAGEQIIEKIILK